MAQIRPKTLMRYGRINEPISVPAFDLIIDSYQSYLLADTSSGSGTITVKNIGSFAINQILIIGEIGNAGTELIKTHTGTPPSGSTVTLASNTVFPHSSGTPIRIVTFDQIEYSTAITLVGAKTVLSTKSITPESDTTDYNDIAGSAGYYFVRFKNTISSTYSPYSDGVPVGGYTIYTARSVIDNALGMINKKTSDTLSDEYGFQQINNCQMEVLREYKRWSFMQVFDYSLGELSTGQWKISLPTNCDDQNTNKSIYNFKIGTGDNLRWIDKEKWNEIIEGVAHTTLASSISVGGLTAVLTDSSDFSDSGTIYIGSHSYSYTANNRTTNTLTLSVASTTADTLGADVFQGATLGTPKYWTTFGGYIYFYPVLGSTLTGRNGYLDYYKALTTITTDSDLIVLPDPNIVQYYLDWKFLIRLNSGGEDASSQAMYNQYIIRREAIKKTEVLGRTYQLKPVLNQIAVNDNQDDKAIRTGNF